MSERLGVVGSTPVGPTGRSRLFLPDGSTVLVDPSSTDAELAATHQLDRIVHLPPLELCDAVHLDGPLAGTPGYAVNRLGYRVGVALPPRPGGPVCEYEVVELADGDRPAGLRLVEGRPRQ